MIIKSTVLAVIVFLGSLGIAAAQSSEPHGTLKGEPGEGHTTEAVVIGWNFFHAFACASRPGTGFFTWVSQEDGSAWNTNDLAAVAMLTPSCQSGNFVGFHVINASLVVDQVLAFPFK
jgi:hypothetical protein